MIIKPYETTHVINLINDKNIFILVKETTGIIAIIYMFLDERITHLSSAGNEF